MAIRWKSKIILFKTETTYGVDAVPTGSNGMLMTNVVVSPMEGEDIGRGLEFPYIAAEKTVPSALRLRLKGRIELAPSGTAGTAPAWGPMMLACRTAQTISAGVSVTYSPISDAMKSGTLYFWIGLTRHVAVGCRGDVAMVFDAQGIAYLEFDIQGLWQPPSEQARPTVTLTGFKDPLLVTNANTPTFTVDAVPLVMRSFRLSLGNQVEPRLLVGREEIVIPDAAERITARVEAVPLSTFDPFALAQSQEEVEWVLAHGTSAGAIATLTVPAAQMQRLSGFENAQNTLEWPLAAVPLPTSGNDQWSLVLS